MLVLNPILGQRPVLQRRLKHPAHAAGALTEPATSLPIPIRDPLRASSADSPPVLPPGLYFVLCGFFATPHVSFELSKLSSVMGQAVFTCGTAPALLSSCTMIPSCAIGLRVKLEYPTEASKPRTCSVSFKLTGIPARGPLRSTSSTHFSASGSSSSVTQFVRVWALTAFLPYAFRMSKGEILDSWTEETRSAIGV